MPIAPLAAEHLRWRVPDGILKFRTTADVPPSEAFVGQENALAALRRGVELHSPGFNVFVAGLPSTGRLGAVERIIRGFSPRRRTGADLLYVSNFVDPARPRLLTLPAGRGVPFRRELVRVASLLLEEMPRVLQGGDARRKREACRHAADATNHAALQRLRQRAETLGFVIGDAGDDEEVEPEVFWLEPMDAAGSEDDEPGDAPIHSRAELQVLGESGELTLPRPLPELLADYDSLSQELAEAQEAGRRVALAAAREMARIDAEAIAAATAPVFSEISRQWPSARAWIAELHEAIVDNVEWFHGDDHEEFIAAFSVNVVHVGTRARKAPIVIVSNPTWQNLLGGIEAGERGSDHRSVRAGALVDADGGFLIVSANELLQEPATWKMLKRGLSFGEMDVQNPGDGVGGPAPVVRPDPMRLDVKVILVGDADTYALLFYGDPDFAKLFKIKAEFEPDAPIHPELLHGCVGFLSRVVHREKLLPLDRGAVAATLEWAVRDAGRGGRISTNFGTMADLVREASFEARSTHASVVTRAHIEAARAVRRGRDDYAERRAIELMEADVLRVDTSGSRLGQVNALVVYHVGGHDFGRPVRLTASVGAGRRGLVSLEAVARLSGKSHDKGFAIVHGILLERFGREGRLTFAATIGFEQSYSKVDGDSATIAEALALYSAIARLPLRQDVAVTGSLDQFGDVQAIGGVNEKIEGFWRTCKARGFTGTQGVLVPHGNVADLCLDEEVRADCAAGRFHVWSARTLDEAVELLFGMPAGERGADGRWNGGVQARVSAGLAELRELVRRPAPRG